MSERIENPVEAQYMAAAAAPHYDVLVADAAANEMTRLSPVDRNNTYIHIGEAMMTGLSDYRKRSPDVPDHDNLLGRGGIKQDDATSYEFDMRKQNLEGLKDNVVSLIATMHGLPPEYKESIIFAPTFDVSDGSTIASQAVYVFDPGTEQVFGVTQSVQTYPYAREGGVANERYSWDIVEKIVWRGDRQQPDSATPVAHAEHLVAYPLLPELAELDRPFKPEVGNMHLHIDQEADGALELTSPSHVAAAVAVGQIRNLIGNAVPITVAMYDRFKAAADKVDANPMAKKGVAALDTEARAALRASIKRYRKLSDPAQCDI